jgi:putative hydrolase of the HAD superfamily
MTTRLKAVLFDFGGVLAEEGFARGLHEIGRKNRTDPRAFFEAADALIYETGYLTGMIGEAAFWTAVRDRTGISGSDGELRDEIISRFTLRPAMLESVDSLRAAGLVTAMLSDQTNWLEEIDRETGLFRHFDAVFNSFVIHKSKRDASVFGDVCATLGVGREATLFIDDNISHIGRARSEGLQTIHFTGIDEYRRRLADLRESLPR